MKRGHTTAGIFFLISTLLAHAEWKTLVTQDGGTAEIVADFRIDDIHIDSNGATSLVAKVSENGEEIGFSALLSKPRKGTIGQFGKDEELPILRSDVTIRSIGRPTTALERLLNLRFQGKDKRDAGLRLEGLYSAICPYLAASVGRVAVFEASDVGLTFDQTGKTIPGECFFVVLVVDGPMERLTAYFSLPAGYGGTSEATRARQRWYETKKNEANQAAEPTRTTVTPPADAGDRAIGARGSP